VLYVYGKRGGWMNKGEIHQAIDDFLNLIEKGKDSIEANEQALIPTLDKLALAYHSSAYEFDEQDYPEPPSKDYQKLRAIVTERFPNFGYYNLPQEVTTKISETEILVGDAIDDITDITRDMQEIRWRWNNTSDLDALWYFRLGYYSHWGNHLRELQFYLYALTYEG
jgi:hypothetical protein